MIQVTLLGMYLLGAAPDQLHEATRALDDLQYQLALQKLPEVGAIVGWRREDVLESFATRALALLGLKRETEARQAFQQLFSLAPDWTLPDQYGPRVRTFVSSARAEAVRAGAISLRFEGGVLRTTPDAFGFARELEVFWREPEGSWQSATLPLQDRQPPPWPRERRLDVWGRVRGLEGSSLFEWGSENAPIRLEPSAAVVVEGGTTRPLGALGLAGLGAGGAALIAAAVGVGFAVGSGDAERARDSATRDEDGRINSLTQRDAFALDARATADSSVATGLFVASAVLVAAGAGLVLFDRLRVTPAAGGAVISVSLDASFAFAGVEGAR